MMLDNNKLINTLVEAGLLIEEQSRKLIEELKSFSGSLEDLLLSREIIAQDHLGQIISDIYQVPYVNLKKRVIDEKVLNIIPELVARHQKAIAFERDKAGLKLAMVDPENEEFVNFLRKKTGDKITIYYASGQDIMEAIAHYRRGIKEEFDVIIKQNVSAVREKGETERELPITRIVDTVLEYAYNNKASDIHLEPHEKEVSVRFRIDGVLHDVVSLPRDIHQYIITRIKVMAKLRTDEHQSAQDGRLEFVTEDNRVDVRVSIVPVFVGEKVVLRLLSEKSRHFKLIELGMSEAAMKKVEKAMNKPYGMILATGPTGSGKTTTLYSILKILNTREVNIATIEDPVEYDISGVNQIQANPKTNLTFAAGLRSILRQDPDIIMVGEIRDEETASIAINAAMTGHLVLSTLHTNDAPTTLPRLLDMKVQPFLISSTVIVAIAQRLVRRTHQNCLESYLPKPEALAAIRQAVGEERFTKFNMNQSNFRLYRGVGCKLCNQTGYEGRAGIFEVMEISEEIRRLIMRQANSNEIRIQAIKEGMVPMLEDGLVKAINGLTTIEEVLRTVRD